MHDLILHRDLASRRQPTHDRVNFPRSCIDNAGGGGADPRECPQRGSSLSSRMLFSGLGSRHCRRLMAVSKMISRPGRSASSGTTVRSDWPDKRWVEVREREAVVAQVRCSSPSNPLCLRRTRREFGSLRQFRGCERTRVLTSSACQHKCHSNACYRVVRRVQCRREAAGQSTGRHPTDCLRGRSTSSS